MKIIPICCKWAKNLDLSFFVLIISIIITNFPNNFFFSSLLSNSSASVPMHVFILAYKNIEWVQTNLICMISRQIMGSTKVRYTIYLMDEFPDAIDTFSSTSSVADLYWDPPGSKVHGGSSLPKAFKTIFSKLSEGEITVLVDPDAVVLAHGWDAYLYYQFQDASVGFIGINPRGKTHAAHRDLAEWNWCAYRTIILRDAFESHTYFDFMQPAAEYLGRTGMEQGGVFTYLYCLHNMSQILFPGISRPFVGKSPQISGNPAGTLNWAIHMFYLSRRHKELVDAPKHVLAWAVDETQEREILTWVRTRNATSYWWCFNSTNFLSLEKQIVYLPNMHGFPCEQTTLEKTYHCKVQTSG